MIFFRQSSLCLFRGSLACTFSGVLMWMQYVTSASGINVPCIPQGNKGFGNLL